MPPRTRHRAARRAGSADRFALALDRLNRVEALIGCAYRSLEAQDVASQEGMVLETALQELSAAYDALDNASLAAGA